MKNKYWYGLCFILFIAHAGHAQIVEQAADDFGSYCQPDNASGNVSLTTDQVRNGSRAFLHRVENVFPRRAELDDCSFHRYNPDRIYWYGFSLYLPSASFNGNFLQFVAQWRFSNLAWGGYSLPNCEMFRTCEGGGIYGGSGHHLLVHDQKWVYSLVHQEPGCASCQALDHLDLELADISTDRWTDFVIESHFSAEQDGYINIWMQVDGEGYEQVAAYRGRTWVKFYQDNSDQRDNGVNDGRVMAPNHTVGLYYGSDNRARTMYSDAITVYQEEQQANGFEQVSINGTAQPPLQEIGPQNWLNESIGQYTEAFEVKVDVRPRQVLTAGGVIGFGSTDAINELEDLGVILRFDESQYIQAINGAVYQSENTIQYQADEILSFQFTIDPTAKTYSATLKQSDGTLLPIATDYSFYQDWNANNSISHFSYHTQQSGSIELIRLQPIRECAPTTAVRLPIAPTSNRYAVGFDLSIDGSNLDTAYVSSTNAMSAGWHFRILPDRTVEAYNGDQYEQVVSSPLAQRTTLPMKVVVDEQNRTYRLSVFDEQGEHLWASNFALDQAWNTQALSQLVYRSISGGCIAINNVQVADLEVSVDDCSTFDWTAIAFPVEPFRFSIEHDLVFQQRIATPATIGLTTNRTVEQVNDLGFFIQCLPDGSIAYVQANGVRTDINYQLVVGERYRCRWEVDVQSGNYDFRIINSVGQEVVFATFSTRNTQWINPSNALRQLVFTSGESVGCPKIEHLAINPCGPVGWQSFELPLRNNGILELSFKLTPSGDDFAQGELVLSSTPIPTESSVISRILLDSTGVFLAQDGTVFSAETSYRHLPDNRVNCRWVVDMRERQYDFQVDKFTNFKDIAQNYAFNPEWSDEFVGYLCYRTYQNGCIQISALAEGRACGPESWSTQALQESVSESISFEMEITPEGNNFRDGVWGLSHRAVPNDFNDLGPILQFNADGNIKVRNGGSYEAEFALPYRYNDTYRFKFNIDISSKRYSVFWVDDGDLITLANNYQFRADWTGDNLLQYAAQRTVGAGCLQTNLFDLVTSVDTQHPTSDWQIKQMGSHRFELLYSLPTHQYRIHLYNIVGQEFYSAIISSPSFELNNMLTLPSGVYALQVVNEHLGQRQTILFFNE